jgi:2-methylisocitrate lyase-like PEP mutase family enzyme
MEIDQWKIKGVRLPDSIPSATIAQFHRLHASGCFILPNPWDVGSAIYLESLGFKALATTSGGFAFSKGLPDSSSAVSLDLTLDHLREIVAATSLPVNADFQNGFADDAEGVAANVKSCIETGVAGLSIEDNTGNASAPLYERGLAVQRVAAARSAIDQTGAKVLLTARCEAWLVGVENPFAVALERLVAYAAAGADCLYAPGASKLSEISAIVKAVSPLPVNVIISRPSPDMTFAKLADLGVRRISVGSALARVAWGGFMRAAQAMASSQSFDGLELGAPYAELNKIFKSK